MFLIPRRTNHATSNCWHKGKPHYYHYKKFGHVEKNCRFKVENQAMKKDVDDRYLFYPSKEKPFKHAHLVF